MKTTLDKCWHVGGVILMILAPIAFVGIVINDYAHPEWASNWLQSYDQKLWMVTSQ